MTPGPPTVGRKKPKCGHHPRYEGRSAPKAACPICWGMYLADKYGMKRESFTAPASVRLSDAIDVQQFIDGLKSALDRSKANGGCYQAFAHTADGGTIEVEVYLRGKPR